MTRLRPFKPLPRGPAARITVLVTVMAVLAMTVLATSTIAAVTITVASAVTITVAWAKLLGRAPERAAPVS